MRVFTAACALTLSAGASWSQTLPAPSLWQNELGSILAITSVDSTGEFNGSFTNRAKNYECKDKAFPVKGRVLPSMLFFATDFDPCLTVAAWTGTLKGDKIETTWEIEYIDKNTGKLTKDTGSDTFTKLP